MSFFEFLKKHKLSSILIVVIVVYFLWHFLSSFFFGTSLSNLSFPTGSPGLPEAATSFGALRTADSGFQPNQQVYPQPVQTQQKTASNSQNRVVTHEADLSLVVSDVRGVSDKIINYTNSSGGYMVSSSFSNPGEAPTATVVVRVYANNLNKTLAYFRQQSLQLVSENLTGEDITDQYKDVQAQLATLTIIKAKFQSILDKTNVVSEILDIQQRIIDVQSQIDQLKGQQQYLEQSAQLSKITVYLSTDELALPYTPNDTWRPTVVFKNASRSLISTLRGIGSMLIWITVYAVIWLPLLGLVIILKRRLVRKKL